VIGRIKFGSIERTCMEEPLGYLEVARDQEMVYTRVHGLGVASIGLDLRDFTEEMLRQGFTRFIIDLADCRSIDSTFMGVLVGIPESPGVGSASSVVVINPSDHNLKLMEGLGLLNMITIRPGTTEPPDLALTRLIGFPRSPEERVLKIRDVHLLLVKNDPRNQAKFKPFLDLLERELNGS
jgi:anti-sigma B factor antagonist